MKKEYILKAITYICSSFGILVLGAIVFYIFKNGISLINWDLITGNYYSSYYSAKIDSNNNMQFDNPGYDNFSINWGIALEDAYDLEGNEVVKIIYIDELSPLKRMDDNGSNNECELFVGCFVSKIVLSNENSDFITAYGKNGANIVCEKLDLGTRIQDMTYIYGGGGIRGSLLTTLYLIVLTLIIALPLGIGSAIYLNEYEKNSKIKNILRQMIDMTSGIPSIIFGFIGVIIFIPFMNGTIKSDGGSIASGALTLSIMLLPVIVKTTEESLKVVPNDLRMASLALGASKTETIFKIVLPNTISGILTAILLSIGRIIGESAALIYAIGTSIKDTAVINERSTTLAVHIWSVLAGDKPNYNLACAISIIILIFVLILNISVKLLSKKLNRLEG